MTPDRRTYRTDTVVFVVLMFITGVTVVLWEVFAPIGMDDYYFRTVLETNDIVHYEWCFNRRIETFGDALMSAGNLFRYDVGRWPNLLHILFTPLPVIAERIFLSIALTAIFYMMSIIVAGSRRPKAIATAFVTAAIWTSLPWYDSMYSLSYQANYILPTAVTAAYILWLPKAMESRKRSERVFFLLFCVLLGQCHEAFGISAAAYTLGVLLRTPKGKRKFPVAVILFILIGFCINLYAGTWKRFFVMKDHQDGFGTELPYLFTRIIIQSWPLWCALALFAIKAAFGRKGRKAFIAENLPYVFGILANAAILFAVHGTGRPAWAGIVMSILLAGSTLRPLFIGAGKRTVAAIGLIFAALYGIWAVELIKWQKRISEETDVIVAGAECLGNSATDVYSGPYTPSADIPYYLMETVRNPVDDEFTARLIASSVKPAVRAPMILAISPLMEGPYEDWPEIEGTAGIRGVWPLITTDRQLSGRLRFTFDDKLPDNISPINRLTVLIKEGRRPVRHELDLCFRADTITVAGNKKVLKLNVEPVPRTIKGRKVLRIDTIPQL